jgi:hypothetical protein
VLTKRLRIDSSSLAQRRSDLIKKGLIYASEYGKVAFTVPNMAKFINNYLD